MTYLKAAAGTLAIMMASGMIADFEVSQRDNETHVRIWLVDEQPDGKLRRHVAAMLPREIDETRVSVVRG